MTISDKQIGLNLRGARARRGLTQAELGSTLGLLPAAVSEIEGGKRYLKLTEAASAAKTLRIDIRQLLDEG